MHPEYGLKKTNRTSWSFPSPKSTVGTKKEVGKQGTERSVELRVGTQADS